jgi:hypothetical protein
MTKELKRISLMIREEQYNELTGRGLNISGHVRDLLDDYLSEHTVILSVDHETKELYDLVMANTGSSDQELEKYLKMALKSLLEDKIKYMESLKNKLQNTITN